MSENIATIVLEHKTIYSEYILLNNASYNYQESKLLMREKNEVIAEKNQSNQRKKRHHIIQFQQNILDTFETAFSVSNSMKAPANFFFQNLIHPLRLLISLRQTAQTFLHKFNRLNRENLIFHSIMYVFL